MPKYSVNIQGHATSITLEKEFWEQLQKIADNKKISLAKLIQDIDKGRDPMVNKNLSAYIRVFILKSLIG